MLMNLIYKMCLEITLFEITTTSPKGQWVNYFDFVTTILWQLNKDSLHVNSSTVYFHFPRPIYTMAVDTWGPFY